MMRHSLLALFACVAVPHTQSPAQFDDPVAYYSSPALRDITSPAVLRAALHDLIDDHVRVAYRDTWVVLEEADRHPNPATPGSILDLYKNATYAAVHRGNDLYNREHTWPKCYGFPDDCNDPGRMNYPYTDCHHLFLCNVSYNSDRDNKPFGNVGAGGIERRTEPDRGPQAYPGSSNWTNDNAWETWMGRRGDVARALFYLDVRYEGGTHQDGSAEPDLMLTDNLALIARRRTESNENQACMGKLSVLMQWHLDDPVDDKERARNNAVARHQHNRNPFIDHPEWVEFLWGHHCETGILPRRPASDSQGPVPHISELHYDNRGVDVDEFVEVTGPVGVSLDGWRIVAYNGSTRQSYHSLTLSGVIPGAAGSQGALAFPLPGLQEDAGDALALVDSRGRVVDFISYEGTTEALDGPAAGMTSHNIGVYQTSDTEVGHSLQRTTAGWVGPRPSSAGEVNHSEVAPTGQPMD